MMMFHGSWRLFPGREKCGQFEWLGNSVILGEQTNRKQRVREQHETIKKIFSVCFSIPPPRFRFVSIEFKQNTEKRILLFSTWKLIFFQEYFSLKEKCSIEEILQQNWSTRWKMENLFANSQVECSKESSLGSCFSRTWSAPFFAQNSRKQNLEQNSKKISKENCTLSNWISPGFQFFFFAEVLKFKEKNPSTIQRQN